MKVVIVTAYYAPMNVPRAFRATELSREFARRGHHVTVINATTLVNCCGEYLVEKDVDRISLINLGILKLRNGQQNDFKFVKYSRWDDWVKKKLFYFTTNSWLYLYWKLKKYLIFSEKYDLLISVGLPFAIHWGVADKIKRLNIADCYIADYGDPFSKYNHAITVAKYFQWIEKRCIDKFDFISVPTDKAVDSYLWLKPIEQIKVIPQGFDFKEVRCGEYLKNQVPTFAFAGLFYSDIRNPHILFDYLCGCKADFRFIIYTNTSVADSFLCIEPYIKRLGNKLELRNIIPRIDLIYELSKMDFIINMNNATSNQVPSKLIDYSLSKRSVFSFSQNGFDIERFTRFLSSQYDNNDAIDISVFNIIRIVDQYEQVYKSKIESNEWSDK